MAKDSVENESELKRRRNELKVIFNFTDKHSKVDDATVFLNNYKTVFKVGKQCEVLGCFVFFAKTKQKDQISFSNYQQIWFKYLGRLSLTAVLWNFMGEI